MKKILNNIMRVIVRITIFIYCKIVYRVKIEGKVNVPKDGALIFCGNHRNYLDAPLMVATAGRHVHFMAKEELKKVKFFAFLAFVFDAIFVKRDAKDIGAIKTSLKYLKDGACVALFPEGTRNGAEKGEDVKNGVSYFVLNSNSKVIPVGIKGGLKAFQKTVITYGKPMDFEEERKNRKDKEVMKKVTEDIMKEIFELAK